MAMGMAKEVGALIYISSELEKVEIYGSEGEGRRVAVLITFPLCMPASVRTKEEEGEEDFGGRDGEWRGIGREEELKEGAEFLCVHVGGC